MKNVAKGHFAYLSHLLLLVGRLATVSSSSWQLSEYDLANLDERGEHAAVLVFLNRLISFNLGV